MTEQTRKENDYTISIISDSKKEDSGIRIQRTLTKTFNFLSAQITTSTYSHVFEPRGSSAGGAAAVAEQTTIQNFNDIPSSKEIELMHAKLVEMGGRPPELSSILPHIPMTKTKHGL